VKRGVQKRVTVLESRDGSGVVKAHGQRHANLEIIKVSFSLLFIYQMSCSKRLISRSMHSWVTI